MLTGSILLAAALATASGGCGPRISEPARANIAARIEAAEFRGLVIGIVDRRGRCTEGFGTLSAKRPVAPDGDTLFEIGSITKVFTATLLAAEVESGRISLDTPLGQILPVPPASDAASVTLEELATHRSGLPSLPRNLPSRNPADPYAGYTQDLLLSHLAELKLSPRPRPYAYSNLALGTLGEALAVRFGEPYAQLLSRRLLRPLGLRRTFVDVPTQLRAILAPGHSGLEPTSGWSLGVLAGAGALHSSANDLLRFLDVQLRPRGPLAGAITLTHTERRATAIPATAVGIGWHIRRRPSTPEILWHNGGTGGYASFAGFDRNAGRGVTVLTNTEASVDDLGMHLLSPADPLAKPRPLLRLPIADLERFTGGYALPGGNRLTVTRIGEQLYLAGSAGGRTALFASAPSRFFLRALPVEVEFTAPPGEKPSAMTVIQSGLPTIARRVPE